MGLDFIISPVIAKLCEAEEGDAERDAEELMAGGSIVMRHVCPLQARHSLSYVMNLSKSRDMLEYMRANESEINKRNPGRSFADIPIHHEVDGVEHETTAGELMQAWDHAREFVEELCPGCPCNFRARMIGCFSAVPYPISGLLEKWLASHFRFPEKNCRSLVMEMLDDYEIDGKSVDRQRPARRGEPSILEMPKPEIIRPGFLKRGINTSQLIELLLFITRPPRDVMWGLLLDFGAVEGPSEAKENVSALLDPIAPGLMPVRDKFGFCVDEIREGVMRHIRAPLNDGELQELFAALRKLRFVIQNENKDDRAVRGFKNFLLACWTAVGSNSEVSMDG